MAVKKFHALVVRNRRGCRCCMPYPVHVIVTYSLPMQFHCVITLTVYDYSMALLKVIVNTTNWFKRVSSLANSKWDYTQVQPKFRYPQIPFVGKINEEYGPSSSSDRHIEKGS